MTGLGKENHWLVLTEDSAFRDLVSGLQVRYGCQIKVESQSRHILSMMRKGNVQLVIADAHLDCQSVCDFIRAAKADAETRRTLLVIVCANATQYGKSINDALEVACRALGADAFVIMDELDVETLCQNLDSRIVGCAVPPIPIPLATSFF